MLKDRFTSEVSNTEGEYAPGAAEGGVMSFLYVRPFWTNNDTHSARPESRFGTTSFMRDGDGGDGVTPNDFLSRRCD